MNCSFNISAWEQMVLSILSRWRGCTRHRPKLPAPYVRFGTRIDLACYVVFAFCPDEIRAKRYWRSSASNIRAMTCHVYRLLSARTTIVNVSTCLLVVTSFGN